jgi:excisionase family DNA binding protein
MEAKEEVTALEPVAVRRETAARLLDCSPTTIWKLVKAGKLDAVKVGSDDRVTVESIRRLAAAKAAA